MCAHVEEVLGMESVQDKGMMGCRGVRGCI
jgi:hypothetical protein